ncbi:MAG: hypothetical protein V3R52_04335 [Candidatus Neomarinimicrobiota bacterium]
MNNLWKEIKDNVKEWGAVAIEKAEEVSKLAVEKTGDFTKISKIKLDIRQTQKDIDNTFEDLGRHVYLQFKDKSTISFKTDSQFIDSISVLDNFKTKIKNFENEIDNIKQEVEEAEVVEKPKVKTKAKAKTKA